MVDWKTSLLPPMVEGSYTGIEQADSFVFVIKPGLGSVTSRRNELTMHCNNKRFYRLLRREITDAADQSRHHPVISSHNWIYFRETDNFDTPCLAHQRLNTD